MTVSGIGEKGRSSALPFWPLVVLLLSPATPGCGGSSPASPSPSAGSGPSDRVQVSGVLSGFYDLSKRISATTPTLSTFPPVQTTTSSSGAFLFQDVAVGTYTLSFSGQEHIERTLTVQLTSGGPNDLGTIEAVERRVGAFEFSVEMADEMLRQSFYQGNIDRNATARWVAAPTVYVDLDSLQPFQRQVTFPPNGTCPAPTGTLLDTIRDAVKVRVPELTGGILRPALVEVRPPSQLPPERTPGTVIIRGGIADGVLGTHVGDANAKNEKLWGIIELGTKDPRTGDIGPVNRDTTAHELGHAPGRAHTNLGLTIMAQRTNRSCLPSLNDKMYGEYHYRRPPGTRSPDDTRAVEIVVGRVASPSSPALATLSGPV